MNENKIIAVDFDGTLCENAWPDIGKPKLNVIDYILYEQQKGAKLILWTNRTSDALNEAVEWCSNHGIKFDAVNENLPESIEYFGGDTRKVFADEYIDDKYIVPSSITPKIHWRYDEIRGIYEVRTRDKAGSFATEDEAIEFINSIRYPNGLNLKSVLKENKNELL